MRSAPLLLLGCAWACVYVCDTFGQQRSKRFIIYNGNAIVKLVAGVAIPVVLVDKQRMLSGFYNFQAQYMPPPRPLYWWSFYNTSSFPARATYESPRWDASRVWLYATIEALLARTGVQGATCLLRAICEFAKLPLQVQPHDGAALWSELLNAALIPTGANMPHKYLAARDAGSNQANCTQTFHTCDDAIWQGFERFTKILEITDS